MGDCVNTFKFLRFGGIAVALGLIATIDIGASTPSFAQSKSFGNAGKGRIGLSSRRTKQSRGSKLGKKRKTGTGANLGAVGPVDLRNLSPEEIAALIAKQSLTNPAAAQALMQKAIALNPGAAKELMKDLIFIH